LTIFSPENLIDTGRAFWFIYRYILPGSSVGRAGGCVMQLPREIVVEKSGEFREAYPPHQAEHGNPEPSPELSQFREGAETRASARTLREKSEGKRPTPSAQFWDG